MKTLYVVLICTLISFSAFAQKRLNPPKSKTNIESVDKFVDAAFTIYNTTFDFHYGITEESVDAASDDSEEVLDEESVGEETDGDAIVEEEEKKDEFKVMEESIGQLMESVPDILEEIDNHSVSKQLKATLNVNKAIKALKHSGKLVKMTFAGE